MAITCALTVEQAKKLFAHAYKVINELEENTPFDHEFFMKDLFTKIAERTDADNAAKFIQELPRIISTAAIKGNNFTKEVDTSALRKLHKEFTDPEKGIDNILSRYDSTIKSLQAAVKENEKTLNSITLIQDTDIIYEDQYLPTIATSTSFYQLAPFSKAQQDDPLAKRVEDENRKTSYAVLNKLKTAQQTQDGAIRYQDQDLYLKATVLSKVPRELWDETTRKSFERTEAMSRRGLTKRATAENTPVVILTNKSGDPILFDENGDISKTGTGSPVFQFLRNVQEVDGELQALDPFGEYVSLADPEVIAALTKQDPELLKEKRREELAKVKKLNDSLLRGEEHFLSLAGISEGVKPALVGNYIKLSSVVEAYSDERLPILSSIVTATNGGTTVTILGDVYPMDRPNLSEELIEEIASALTSPELSDNERKRHYFQFYPDNVKISEKSINHQLRSNDLTFFGSSQTFEESKPLTPKNEIIVKGKKYFKVKNENADFWKDSEGNRVQDTEKLIKDWRNEQKGIPFAIRATPINGVTGNVSQAYLKTLTPDQRNKLKEQIKESLQKGAGEKEKYFSAILPIRPNLSKDGFFRFNKETQTLDPTNYWDTILPLNTYIKTANIDQDKTYNAYFVFDTNPQGAQEIRDAVTAEKNEQPSAIRQAKDNLVDHMSTKSVKSIDTFVRLSDISSSNKNERLVVENPLTKEDLITVVPERIDLLDSLDEGDLVTLKLIQPGMEGYNEDVTDAIGIYVENTLLGFVAETDFKAGEKRRDYTKKEEKQIKEAEIVADTQDKIDDTPQLPEEDDDLSINVFNRSVLLDNNVTEAEIKAAEEWWKTSPLNKYISLDASVQIVNSDAYAKFITAGAKLMSDSKFGKIEIHPSGSFVDVYHEAWHGFSQLFLTKKEKIDLYNEVRNSNPKYKDYTFLQIEELLAEDFRSYAKSPKPKANSPKRNTIFRKIFNFLRTLFGLNKKGQGITQQTYSSDLFEIPTVKKYFTELYFANKNPNILRKYTPMMENVIFNKLDRGITKIGRSGQDALSKADSDLISKSIDSIISQFIDEQAVRFGSKSVSLAYFSEEIGKESGKAPKDVLYRVVKTRLENRLAQLREEFSSEIKSPLAEAKTLKDVEKAAVGVIKSKEGNDKYIFLSSQVTDFTNLELAIKKGNKAKGRSYFGIDIVTDFYKLKTVKNINGKPVDIIIASDRDNAVSQFENYKRGGAKEFESITFNEESLLETPLLTPKQERQLHNIKVLEKALENWGDKNSGVIKYHTENSTFDITRQVFIEAPQFDENGEEIDESDTDEASPGDTYSDKVGTKSLLELADKETIYAIKSLFKIENDKKVLNELGFPELVDFRSTWNVIARELANTTDRQVMYDKLVELSKTYPEIKQLIKYKLPAPGEIAIRQNINSRLVNYEFNISNSFWQTFSKARIPIINTVLFLKESKTLSVDGGQQTMFEAQILKSVRENPIILAEFKTKFQTDKSNKYRTTTTDGTNVLDINKLLNDFKNIESLSGSKQLEFLTALGFYIDDLKVIKKELETNVNHYGLTYLYKYAEGIAKIDSMPDATSAQRDLSFKFKTNPITALESKLPAGVLPGFKGEVSQRTQVNRLAQLQADMGVDSADFGATNAAGNKMYELMEQFTISKIAQSISDLDRLNDAWDNTGTNQPKFTSYLDPSVNSFTLRSQILNSIFEMDSPIQEFSKRHVDAKLVIEYFGGSAVEGLDEAYGKETTKLDPTSYVLQQMHTMLKGGIAEFIRHASKSASFGARVDGVPIKSKSILKNPSNLYVDISMFKDETALPYAIDKILIPYIAVEFDRINKFNSDPSLRNIAGYNKKFYYRGKEQLNGQSFLAFDDVLSKSTLDWLYAKADGKNLSIDIIAEINNPANSKIKDAIYEDIKKYFERNTSDNLELISALPAVDRTLIEKAGNLNNAVAAFTMNYWIHNFETIHLFYGDMAQYDHVKDDLFKRNTGATSNGPGFLNDTAAHNFINDVFNNGTTYADKLAKDALKEGNTDLAKAYQDNKFVYNGILRTAVVEETVRPQSEFYSEIEEGLREDYTQQFSRLKLTKAEIKKLVEERVSKDMKAYSNMEEGDGAGYITFDAYRTLKKLENDWSDPQENLYQKIINGVEVTKEEAKLGFPAYKLQNYGPLANVNLPAFAMHKFALFPIIPSVYKRSELEKLHKIMLRKNIQYLTFASGSKVASISKNGSPDVIYADAKKTQILDDIEFTPNLVFIESLKKSASVSPKLKGNIKDPTQRKGIIIDNLFDKGEIRSPELQVVYDNFKTSVDNHSEILKIDFLNEIGFKYDSKSKRYTGDLEKLLTVFQRELERRDVPEHLVEFLGVDLNGNLINDLSLHLEADTLEKIILSVIQKRLVQQTVNGEALVQMPNSMMNGIWDTTLKVEKDPEKIRSLIGTNTLPFYERSYEIVNGKKVYGKTKPMKIAIALQGDFYNLLELEYNGAKIETIDRLNEAIKDEEWLKENGDAITVSGARIPIQKLNSLEFAQVWHFLDPAASNTVIVPTELVAKAGSDFDVDKISWNFPNLNKEGKVITESTSNKEIERRLNSKDPKDKKGLSALIANKKKAAQNDMIKAQVAILERPEMYANLVRPNDTYVMKEIADELQEVATDYNKFYAVHDDVRTYKDKSGTLKPMSSPTRALEVGMNRYKFQVNLEGKDSLGIVANQNKTSPILKSIGAKLPKEFNITYYDKKRQMSVELDDVTLPYRIRLATDMIGDQISLSGNYSLDGERIADMYDHTMNGLLDVEKDAWVFYLQTNTEMVNTFNTLIEMGIPKRDIIYFISQPLARAYVTEQKRLKSQYNAAQTKKIYKLSEAKKQAAANVIGNRINTTHLQKVNEAKIKHIISKLPDNKTYEISYIENNRTKKGSVKGFRVKEILKSNPVNSIISIVKDVDKKVYEPATLNTIYNDTNIYYLDEVLNEGKVFKYKDDLENTIKDINADNQINVLVHLMAIQAQMGAWESFKLNNKPDTKIVKTTYQMNKQELSYDNSLESSKLDKETVKKLREDSVLSSFNIADFALDVTEPLFNLRLNPFITRFIEQSLKDQRGSITKNGFQRGLEGEEMFTGAFNNAVINFIFQNTLSNFTNSDGSISTLPDTFQQKDVIIKAGLKNHVEVTEDKILVDINAIRKDYSDKVFLRDSSNANSYDKRGLKSFFEKDKVFPTQTSFTRFVLEREYLRYTTPLEEAKSDFIYKKIASMLAGRRISEEKIYETFLAQKALIRAYNRAGLMKMKDFSYSDILMDVINSNMDALSAFPVVKQLYMLQNPSLIRRGLRVIGLKNKAEVVGELAETYENNIRQLADPSIKKVEDKKLNLFISQMFGMLPLVSTYQHGVGYSMAGFPKALPTGGYLNIMKRAEDVFVNNYLNINSLSAIRRMLLEQENGKYTKGYKNYVVEPADYMGNTVIELPVYTEPEPGVDLTYDTNIEIAKLSQELSALEESKEAVMETPNYIIATNIPKITPESAQKETGGKVGIGKDIGGGILSKETGITVQEAAHRIWEDFFFEDPRYTTQDIRDVIIDVLMTGKKAYIDDLMNTSRINELKRQIADLEANVTTEVTTETVNDSSEYTNYSGGALGADTVWAEIGKEYGLGKQINYRPDTLKRLTKDQLQEVENAYQRAVQDLGRKALAANTYAGGLVRRDYLQAKAADAVYAVSTLVEPGQKDTKGYINKTDKKIVSGGTGYAVQMAINLGKPVFVFNQADNTWWKYDNTKGDFVVYGVTPTLTKNFAGIGTREITEAGKQAIRDVYANTFKATSQPAFTQEDWYVKLKDKLQELYPEIELEVTNNPKWEEDGEVFNQKEYGQQVDYRLAAVNILKSDKAAQMFAKGKKNNWNLNKILTELQVPKQQKEILLNKTFESGYVSELDLRENLIISLLAENSFTVKINTATEKTITYKALKQVSHPFQYNGDMYDRTRQRNSLINVYTKNGKPITDDEYNKAFVKKQKEFEEDVPTQYYSKLTVPGGINYTENEIAIPEITPIIKGHAQFATDKGIGWFRSDDKIDNIWESQDIDPDTLDPESFELAKKAYIDSKNKKYSSRRILEVQSDLFQKGRSNKNLTADLIPVKEEEYYNAEQNGKFISDDYGKKIIEFNGVQFIRLENVDSDGAVYDTYYKTSPANSNQFLQLLNQDNNWVTFFVKSIIQDSAKKGYEKVLFPTGDTAAKIEGHTTLEEFKKQKEDRISKLEKEIANDLLAQDRARQASINNQERMVRESDKEWQKQVHRNKIEELKKEKSQPLQNKEKEINQLKQELERIEKEGFGALKPIYNFYENTVTNILKKQGYNPVGITDEFGNKWNQIEITPKVLSEILLQKNEANQIIGQANIKAMTVLIDAVNQKRDTLPHEYAHHYIAWYRDTPIVQEAIKKWGSEEALVQAIGEQVVKQKGEAYSWWQKFVKWILGKFDKLSTLDKEQLSKILTDAFLTRQDLSALTTQPSVNTPVANIPQNKVSGIESFGSLVTANANAIKVLGPNPHSIDMIEAGFRTRTTRSESEMAKYAIKVGDVIKHFGKSADGSTKNILARVTAIHPKGSPGWKGTWNKEGWRAEDVDVIDRFKDGAAAIEFEVIQPTQPTLKRGGKIISDTDITRYNTYLSKLNGVKPKEFFTSDTKFSVFYNNQTGKREGAPQTSKWILKDNGYYDLIDQVSGEIYIDNVDLQTGYKFEEPIEGGFGTTETC